MAKYMIPNEFPSDLYDFAKPHARAHWTSYPTYSYEQFYRANPRGKHNPADPKARYKALQAVADDERANENERKIARRLMSKMEAEGLVKPKKAKKNPRKAHHARRNSGEPIFIPVAGNAGRFTPNIFPYGVGGRPAIYPADPAAKGNPKTVDPAWKVAAERLLAKRTGRSMDDFSYRAYLRAVIAGTMPVTHTEGIPYIGALEARQDLIDEYGKGPAKGNPRPGKYKSVQEAGGLFAIPEKAPREGSFPIDTIKRARYALALVAAPAFDEKPSIRARVIKAVVAEYPQLRAEADHVRDRVEERAGRSQRAAANPRRRR